MQSLIMLVIRVCHSPLLSALIKLECNHKICKLAFVILRLGELYSIMGAHN